VIDQATLAPETAVIQLPRYFELDVSITAEDLSKGVRSDPQDCPGALALVRAMTLRFGIAFIATGLRPSVGSASIAIMGRDLESCKTFGWSADAPPALRTFTEAYDRCGTASPVSFRLCLHWISYPRVRQ
jgi:hypothetical protein